jgi:hypothetical protein
MAGSTQEPAPLADPMAEPAPMDDMGSDMASGDMAGDDMAGGDEASDKPFDDEPFDAGVEADEETDPKKFIEQLTGKLGQSLRKYTEEQGQPDFELEKFAINSLLSATHTSEMDAEDQKDIISKVRTAGEGDEEPSPDADMDMPSDEDMPMDEPADEEGFEEPSGEDELSEVEKANPELYPEGWKEMDGMFLKNPPKNNMFQPGSNDKLNESCWKGYKQVGMKDKDGKQVPNCVPIEEGEGLWANIHAKRKRGESPAKPGDEDYPDKKQWDKLTKEENVNNNGESNNYMFWQNLKSINDNAAEILSMNVQEVDALLSDGHSWAVEHVITSKDDVEEVYHFLEYNMENKPEMMAEERDSTNYMFFASLKTILHASSELMEMDEDMVDSILSNGHGWALDHIATAADDMEEVYHFLANTLNAYDGDTEGGYEDEFGSVQAFNINEAEYQGRTVKLGKPMKGDVKKFKVFVKNKGGKVVKVNFGDPNMEIRRDNPKRRKSFRARHKCAQAKDRTKPKYWSCRMWSRKPVSKMVEEGLSNSENFRIFDKMYLKGKLHETFNQDDTMNQPMTEPAPVVTPTKPAEKPIIQPSRKDKPFLPMPEVTPDPKAKNNG